MRRMAVVGLLGALTGCARMPVVSERPESLGYENCHLLGSIDEAKLNWRDYSALREEAAKMGGNVVYAHAGGGDAYRCDPPKGTPPAPCAKDADCKFDRICELGVCVNPTPNPPKP